MYCLWQVSQFLGFTFLETQFKFCGLMEYMRFVDDDSNWCVLVICLQISLLGLLQGPQKPSSVLSGGTLTLTRMSFKLFPFLKPIIRTFSKTLLCSLSVLEEDEFLIKYS